MKPTLTLEITLVSPPAGVTFGVQEGHGSNFQVVQTALSTGQDLTFTIPVTLDAGDFRGAFVQGKKGERFVYVNSGTLAGEAASHWTRRAKIHLRDLPPGTATRGGKVRARVLGTAKDGGPCCATCPLEDGWERAD